MEIRNLAIGYKGRPILENINFDIFRGDCIMLCGANGSGKTTLLRTLAGYSPDITAVMIPTGIPKVQGFTLRDFVRVSCFRQSDLTGRLSPQDSAALDSALSTLGITGLAGRDISTLSDGEFQKACIASALVRRADLILLDEPTAFLDPMNRISVLTTLRSLCIPTDSQSSTPTITARQEASDPVRPETALNNKEATSAAAESKTPAIIFSTHDLADGLKVCTRVIALSPDKKLIISSENLSETAHSFL